MADLRDLLYSRAFSEVLCRCSEFCFASTWNTVARAGAGRRDTARRMILSQRKTASRHCQAPAQGGSSGRRVDGTCEHRGSAQAGAEAEGAAAWARAGLWSSHVAGLSR